MGSRTRDYRGVWGTQQSQPQRRQRRRRSGSNRQQASVDTAVLARIQPIKPSQPKRQQTPQALTAVHDAEDAINDDLDAAALATLAKLRTSLKRLEPVYSVSVHWVMQDVLFAHTRHLQADSQTTGRISRYEARLLLAVGCTAPFSGRTRTQGNIHGDAHLYVSQRLLDTLMTASSDADIYAAITEAERLEYELPRIASSLHVATAHHRTARFVALSRRSGVALDDYRAMSGVVEVPTCEACLAAQSDREALRLRGQAIDAAVQAQWRGGRVFTSRGRDTDYYDEW